jgi:hypothetical protein
MKQRIARTSDTHQSQRTAAADGGAVMLEDMAMRMVLVGCMCAAVGCVSSERVDIGDNRAAALGAQLSDYQGSWSGYAEAYKFNDGHDSVRLKLDAKGSGVLEVGDASRLPEADSDHAPPGAVADAAKGLATVSFGQLISGFSYPVYDAQVETQRIRLSARTSDLYRDWCQGQTSQLEVGATPESYNCVGGGFSYANDKCMGPDGSDVDCGKLACVTACACTKDSCDTAAQSQDVMFDGALQGDDGASLVGTLVIANERVTVRLERN